jgi:cell division protein ZapA (FtsZ GTPase activity inhibitor)
VKETDATLIPVNVIIAGRSYRIRIAASDEAFVRKAVKRANDQIAELRRTYAGKDDQDFIAMCLLMYATDKRTNSAESMLEEELMALSHKIDAALGGES